MTRSWVRSVDRIDHEIRVRREYLKAARDKRDVTMIIEQQDKINELLEERWKATGNG